jgi:CheY-like chemotaxis protein
MNLAVNARDAMLDGGTLTIEIADVSLATDYSTRGGRLPSGPYVTMTFTDTGTGMTPDVLAHLFEPFFTTKGPGKGTGLGLATVHGIVEHCGGGINVESVIGRGTVFTLYFPQTIPSQLSAAAKAPNARAHARAQLVLVVDDDLGVRDLARRLLERAGYRVLVAANAAEGRALVTANPSIDLILTDVIMPGDSGPEFVRSLHQPNLKVVYMSGFAEDTIAHHGVLDPGIVFLHKPFTAETLNRKVGEGLDGAALIAH